MSRMSPRITINLPVKLEAKSARTEMIMTDLGLNGAFLKGDSLMLGRKLSVNTPVLLQYNLAGKGMFEQKGSIVREETGGYAINFHDLDIAAKSKLWDFITGHLSILKLCPYCGEKYISLPPTCKYCGWDLNFDSPEYLHHYEKIYMVKKLYSKILSLNDGELQKILNYIHMDILKTKSGDNYQEFVGTSSSMLEVFANIRRVASTNLTVLVLGESGTGKELTALAIHDRSPRKDKPFVAINCAAIPENLLEAELFGYERGAFTGAYAAKKGKFEYADGGTIFLDEIGEMPINLQTKLLRFLQDKTVEKIGGIGGKKVDVRMIAATNRDLSSAIAEGRFRNDLYYRLDEFTINLPPVRERGGDKVILAKFFLNKFSMENGVKKEFSKEAVEAMLEYDWPGNAREIINKVRRAVVMSADQTITPTDLALGSATIKSAPESNQIQEAFSQFELEKIRSVLSSTNNNISKSAKILGFSRPTLYSKLKKYGFYEQ